MASSPAEAAGVQLLNSVLNAVGLQAQIETFDECAQASVFVAIFERLFRVRLSDVIRSPATDEDRVQNCQRVIDALGGMLGPGDAVTAEKIIERDAAAINALIQCFAELCQPESMPSTSDVGRREAAADETRAAEDANSDTLWAADEGGAEPPTAAEAAVAAEAADWDRKIDASSSTSSFSSQRQRQRRPRGRKQRKPRREQEARPSSAPSGSDWRQSAATFRRLSKGMDPLELQHWKVQLRTQYEAATARETERVAALRQSKYQVYAERARQRELRQQQIFAARVSEDMQEAVRRTEARRDSARERVTRHVYREAIREKRASDLNARRRVREREVERKQVVERRLSRLQSEYEQQCAQLDESKQSASVRSNSTERSEFKRLQKAESQGRRAVLQRLADLRDELEQEERALKAGLEDSPKQWQMLLKRIAARASAAGQLCEMV